MQIVRPAARTILSTSVKRQWFLTHTITRTFATIHLDAGDQELHQKRQHHNQQQQQCAHSLLILGKPGGGKGTISGKILRDFPQFRHVSTGDELRQHVRNETPLGKEAKKYMDGAFKCRLGLERVFSRC